MELNVFSEEWVCGLSGLAEIMFLLPFEKHVFSPCVYL